VDAVVAPGNDFTPFQFTSVVSQHCPTNGILIQQQGLMSSLSKSSWNSTVDDVSVAKVALTLEKLLF
jgi:hypothetical protein